MLGVCVCLCMSECVCVSVLGKEMGTVLDSMEGNGIACGWGLGVYSATERIITMPLPIHYRLTAAIFLVSLSLPPCEIFSKKKRSTLSAKVGQSFDTTSTYFWASFYQRFFISFTILPFPFCAPPYFAFAFASFDNWMAYAGHIFKRCDTDWFSVVAHSSRTHFEEAVHTLSVWPCYKNVIEIYTNVVIGFDKCAG